MLEELQHYLKTHELQGRRGIVHYFLDGLDAKSMAASEAEQQIAVYAFCHLWNNVQLRIWMHATAAAFMVILCCHNHLTSKSEAKEVSVDICHQTRVTLHLVMLP